MFRNTFTSDLISKSPTEVTTSSSTRLGPYRRVQKAVQLMDCKLLTKVSLPTIYVLRNTITHRVKQLGES